MIQDTESFVNPQFPLKSIYFYIAKGCNLKCRHCWIAPEYQCSEDNSLPVLDIEVMRSVIEQAKPLGLSGVKLTGGEPLTHPFFPEILQLIGSKGLDLSVETNGTLCTHSIAEQMKLSAKHISVSVSLDGSDAKTHEWVRGVPGSFKAAKEGIKNLVNVGINPQIIMSIMRRNKHQIGSLVILAEEVGASSVKFNPVLPTARGDAMHNSLETLSIDELVELGAWVENILSSNTSLSLYYSHPLAFRPLSRMFGEKCNGCGVCDILSILGVLSDGSYSLCGIGENVPDLVFGSAEQDSLVDIWQETMTLKELREGLPGKLEGVCGNCLMSSICKASCIAQNYYTYNSLWAPYWYCEEAFIKGLFPEARLKKQNPRTAAVKVDLENSEEPKVRGERNGMEQP